MKLKLLLVSIPFIVISFLSCSQTEESEQAVNENVQKFDLPDDGIAIKDAWSRPGSENGVSAIYMTILNGSAESDSIISINSPVARMVEIHETYEREEGMMGMRSAESTRIPARDALIMEPGGMHVMLMQLSREIALGDSIEFSIEFANSEPMTLNAPVQAMQ